MRVLLSGLVAAALAGSAPGSAPKPSYEVFAVRYATLVGFPKKYLVMGADSVPLDLAMMVWVVRGEGRTMLVDAGYYREEFKQSWNAKDFVSPDQAVARLGIRPADVTDVIISHLHWDHADGADLFPRAKVWVQRDEYAFYRDPANQRNSGVFPVDVAMFERIERDGRLALVPGDSVEVAPGVRVYIGGRHTKQSQYVSVPTRSGTVVLASDNMYLYENLDRHRPIAATWDSVSNLAAQDRMRRLASDPRLIVPGHDPAVFERFPAAGPGAAAIR
jgi:glyoxylase-like metal-dependent hydrolase (beta-lactamase superfamily II)